AWSARLASKIFKYSGVSGGACARAAGLLGSQASLRPAGLFHWLSKSGYFCACAGRQASTASRTAAGAVAPNARAMGVSVKAPLGAGVDYPAFRGQVPPAALTALARNLRRRHGFELAEALMSRRNPK